MAARRKAEVISCVQGLQEPKTLTELKQQLDIDCVELERLLQELLEEGSIVCKTLILNECTFTLYWKTIKPSVDTTPTQNHSFVKPNFISPLTRMTRKPRTRLPFKSPVSTKTPTGHNSVTTSREILKQELAEISREITELKECYNVKELDEYIDALHTYNEMKDAGQVLLGQLAVLEGVTTAQLYTRYKLSLDS